MMTNLIQAAIAILVAVESGGKADAIGDRGKAVGILQIWPVTVQEANRLEARKARVEKREARVWTNESRRCPIQSRAMATVILEHHYRRGVTDLVGLCCRWRNPYSLAPLWYVRKIEKAKTERGG